VGGPSVRRANENLAGAKWLALYGSPGRASWARLLPGDDPSQTLRGGGLTLSLAWISGDLVIQIDRFSAPGIFAVKRREPADPPAHMAQLLQVEPLTPVCDAVSTAEGKASHVLLR
jgi:hypothetical protein